MDVRDLPSVDALSRSDVLRHYPERVRVDAARSAISQTREALRNGAADVGIEELAVSAAEAATRNSLRRVINGSGVILHTGLGRARLAPAAAEAIAEAAMNHAAVEFDLETSRRGDRQEHVRSMLCSLTGAEDAFVVNNCAAAVFLTLAATSAGKGVVLSRGQMVEIGGSFRMPDVVRQSGCRLIEVGCTNKTRLSDYREAIDAETAALLRCHPSNFKVVGFVEEPCIGDLAELCRANGLLLIDDVGAGCLVDMTRYGLPPEPMLRDSIAAGADIVMASGDKLLGGTQAGLILGRADVVSAVRKHPLARAVRVDKLTLAGLAATLRLYVSGREGEIPTLQYLARGLDQVRELADTLSEACSGAILEEGWTEVGGGSLPGTGVRTWRVGIKAPNVDDLARKLRVGDPAVVGRIENGLFWLDPRTMNREEVEQTAGLLRSLV